MPKLQPAILRFPKSGSPDVVTYKLYMELEGITVTYDSPSYDIGSTEVDGYIVVDLAAVPGMTTLDGVYNIGVTAVDDAGNESSFSTKNSVPLDFTPPDPPGALEIGG
jgi:hypothetical protein